MRRSRRTSASSPAQQRDQAIVAFATVLRSRLPDTLDDLTKLLAEERGRIIGTLSPDRRIALARSYVSALGLKCDELRVAE